MITKRLRVLLPYLGILLLAGGLRGQTYDIGDRKQLFIDDRFVRDREGVEWRMNPPRKCGVVLEGVNGWEDGMIGGYGTVLADGGRYRMWYDASPASRPHVKPEANRLCYAESTDGVAWTKPNLGLCEWEGSRANNIVMEITSESANVMIDPKAPPAERYKMIARLHQRSSRWPAGNAPAGTGLYIYTSADGLRWSQRPLRVLPFDPDTLNMALYDDRTGKYLAYVRVWNPERRVGVVETDDLMKPWPYTPGIPAPVPGMIEAPTGDIPDAFGRDAGDPPDLDFYTSAVVKYPGADDAYFMFPSAYRHFPEPPVGKFTNDGTLDIDLAVSRDGRKFHRVSREPYVELGLEGARDSRTEYMYIGMLAGDRDICQYYAGTDFSHGEYVGFDEIRHRGGVCLVRQRRDGFVSIDAGEAGGRFSTPPLIYRGRHLWLNLDASGTGEVRVQIEDLQGRPLRGFSFAESDPVYRNDLAAPVTWRKGQADVGGLQGRPVRLSFRLSAAKLYAFQFGE
jgi:hypothetical protein